MLGSTPGFISSVSYLQSVTQNFSCGVELTRINQQRKQTLLTWAGRYKTPNWSFCGTLITPMNMALFNYVHRVNNKVRVATELQLSLDSLESQAQVGYQFALRQSLIGGNITSTGVVSTTFTEQIGPGFAIMFSAQMDHYNSQYKFGTGFNLGQ
jgi:mitochondrial import receptor subunit TOM40